MTPAPPRVSIILPTYNGEGLLPGALASIRDQTYADWEAIVVDDGSDDDTAAVAEAFAASDPERVTVVRLEHNVGVGGARTEGIARSRGGELLCLLDQDDLWDERYLECSVAAYDEAVAQGRPVAIISSNARIMGEDGLTDETWWGRNGWVTPVRLENMLRRNYLNARSLFTRQAYERVGGDFARGLGGSDDLDLWLRILEQGYEAIGVREPLAIYRDHAGSFSRHRLAMSEGKIACLRRALDRGHLGPRERRIARAQIRHWRALREAELCRRAVAARRPAGVLGHGARAVPLGAIAFAQDPARWREWGARVAARVSGAAGRRRRTR
ncbi:MAG TPA: glycosyltransferase family 2 protein [Thermoleophilaceae bacterium]|nr:glycosyltransferase family 2 protein [Thermoleophilaceae bacterium]